MDVKGLPTRAEVLELFFKQWQPQLKCEKVSIAAALNCVCAKDYEAQYNLPVFRSASSDGLAVNFADFADGMPATEQWKRGVNYELADMGDDFPDLFDTVIQIESVEFLEENGGLKLHLDNPLEKGQGVRESGSTIRKGEILLTKGTVCTPIQLSNVARGGYSEIEIFRKPRVTFIPTGSELVPIGSVPERGDNFETNHLLVKMFLERWGAEVTVTPIYRDEQAVLEEEIEKALHTSDIVLVNGGSSKGREDLNTHLIEKRSTFWQHHVRSVPGFPVGIGLVDGIPVINVPGPPMATLAVLSWCVKALVYKAAGVEDYPKNLTQATLTQEMSGPPTLDFYQRIHLFEKDGTLWAEPFGRDAREAEIGQLCNGLLVLEAGKAYPKGASVLVERLFSN